MGIKIIKFQHQKIKLNMKKSILNLFIALISVCTGIQAQSITGSITDSEDGEPLAGVNIIVQGQNKGAVSDFDGNFTVSNFFTVLTPESKNTAVCCIFACMFLPPFCMSRTSSASLFYSCFFFLHKSRFETFNI